MKVNAWGGASYLKQKHYELIPPGVHPPQLLLALAEKTAMEVIFCQAPQLLSRPAVRFVFVYFAVSCFLVALV